MAKKNQHFVPRVYLKPWETDVVTNNEPSKPFKGVYYFDEQHTNGEGATRESILWEPHLYTITFRQLYMAEKCPEVYKYFTNAIYESMIFNSPKPVYGKLGSVIIRNKRDIRKHLQEIQDWEFYYDDGTTARKKSLLNRFNDLRCYILEEKFSSVFESKWENIRNTFLSEVKSKPPISYDCSIRKISLDAAKDMLEFFFMMFCRSPEFDPFGAYTGMKAVLNEAFIDEEKTAEADDIKNMIDEMMDAVWFRELYRMLFKESGGFYNTVISKTVENCQMILFEVSNEVESFITSDNPAFHHISFVEIENMNRFYFPIDPKHMLFVIKGEGEINEVDYRTANLELVRKLNQIIASHKSKLLIANTRKISYIM